MNNYSSLRVGYKAIEYYTPYCMQFKLYNSYDPPERTKSTISDDYFGILFYGKYYVKSIYRLKPKTLDKSQAKSIENIECIEYKGELDNYYWDFLHITGML